MRKKRVLSLRKSAKPDYERRIKSGDVNPGMVSFKRFFRWVKKMYVRHK